MCVTLASPWGNWGITNVFGKSGDKAARGKNQSRALGRGFILRSLSRNNIARSAVGAGAASALVATMIFGGAFDPAVAAQLDTQDSAVEQLLNNVEESEASTGNLSAEPAESSPEPTESLLEPTETSTASSAATNNAAPKVESEPSAESTPKLEPTPTAESGESKKSEGLQKPAKSESANTPTLMAVGPDGTTAPYVHWNVVDEEGTPVAGATFTFERRASAFGFGYWTDKVTVNDCLVGNCTNVDRDGDAGEYLVKWPTQNPGQNPSKNTATVSANARYKITPVTAPTGYEWASNTAAVDSQNRSWTGQGANQTLDVGTFKVKKAKKISNVPMCEAGYVYGLSGSGQMQSVSPTGSVTKLGQPAKSGSDVFNGLGIGTGGSSVYAYERSNSSKTATVYKYDVNEGTWASTGKSINSNDSSRTITFVAGAVNLDTGRYLIGGYSSDSSTRVFRMWEYDPSTNDIVYKGNIAAGSKDGVANGDMAFDSNGNLFIVRGSGSTTTIYSVTAENLASASGGLIASSVSNQVSTMNDVNGVAFDADGKGYLSSTSVVRSYDMPGWTNSTSTTASLASSTDLASCGSPPTISIEKYVEGGRVAATDQFKLTLRQGGANGTEIGTATTLGNQNGLQSELVGPLPTVRNVALQFSETAAGTTNLSNYASSYRCLVDGKQSEQGNGTSGTITIPADGQSVECIFYNSPLTAQVNVHKQVTDAKGENPKPGVNWEVGATATATTGTIKSTPGSLTQKTDAAGTASWKLAFGGKNDKAELNVKEVMQDGFDFKSGTCEVTALDGTSKTTELSGPENNPKLGIVPGDVVDCTFVNSLKPAPAKVLVGKNLLDINGEKPKPAAGWNVGAALDKTSSPGVSISKPETAQTTTNGWVENPWTINFPSDPGARAQVKVQETMQDGYEFVSGTCVITADDKSTREQSIEAVSGVLTGLAPGDSAECSFTNKPKAGTATWQKVDEAQNALAGSEWELTGPGNAQPVAIKDCIAENLAACTGLDRNPAAGKFGLESLAWGEYSLKETKAPAGYVLDSTVRTFTVGGAKPASLIIDLGKIENEQQPALSLPLTGGMGSQTFFIGGGAILLAALAVLGIRRRKGASQ